MSLSTVSRVEWRNKTFKSLKSHYEPKDVPIKAQNLVFGLSYGLVEYHEGGSEANAKILDQLEEAEGKAVRDLVEDLMMETIKEYELYGKVVESCSVTRV